MFSNTGAPTTSNHHRTRENDRINAILDYYHDDNNPCLEDYVQEVENSGESLHCSPFRDGGGRSPFSRNSSRGRGERCLFYNQQGWGDNNSNSYSKSPLNSNVIAVG